MIVFQVIEARRHALAAMSLRTHLLLLSSNIPKRDKKELMSTIGRSQRRM